MPKFVIEREIPGAGNLNAQELQSVSQTSCNVLQKLGPQIQWVQSYVTADKVYCVYIAPNEEMIREHAVQITITGVLLVLTAGASVLFGSATALPLWFALVLGLWTMATPIMIGLSGRSFSANNDIVVGLLVLIAASVAIGSQARMRLFVGGPDPQGAAGQTSLW